MKGVFGVRGSLSGAHVGQRYWTGHYWMRNVTLRELLDVSSVSGTQMFRQLIIHNTNELVT